MRDHPDPGNTLASGVKPLQTAVIIPCYNVRDHILGVLSEIDASVLRIYVVDDKCPQGTGDHVEANCTDVRVVVLRNEQNQGVGGAVMHGYQAAIADKMDILVKVDGDGQMDPALIPILVKPIAEGRADYTKGNRFFSPEALDGMPLLRLFGNAALSFLTKASSGYWDVLDPTNGFTALHAGVAAALPMNKLAKRYFFESDLLFRLNTIRAVVADIPMLSHYGDEKSNMSVGKMIWPFFSKNAANFVKRVVYSYFLRGFSFASVCFVVGWLLFIGGLVFGLSNWLMHMASNEQTPTGTIMIAVVSITFGFQLLLTFAAADIASVPTQPLHKSIFIVPRKPMAHRVHREGVALQAIEPPRRR